MRNCNISKQEVENQKKSIYEINAEAELKTALW